MIQDKKTLKITAAILVLFILGFSVYNLKPKKESELFESEMARFEKPVSNSDLQQVIKMLDSSDHSTIRNGLTLAGMAKNLNRTKYLEDSVFKQVYSKNSELRASALVTLYDLNSKHFSLAYKTVELDPKGLVQYAKDLVKSKN